MQEILCMWENYIHNPQQLIFFLLNIFYNFINKIIFTITIDPTSSYYDVFIIKLDQFFSP